MELPNRKQRRQWAKEAGLLKKKQNASMKERLEIQERTIEYGKKIHLANTENNLRKDDESQIKKQQEQLQNLIASGMSHDDALKTISL